MPRSARTELADPIFSQPVFNESTRTIDQSGFQTPFVKDDAIYKQIEDLLSKDVVSFPKSRIADDDVYTLATAYGPSGDEVVKQILNAKGIVFHAAGDSGATSAKKYTTEVTVVDQMTEDAYTQEVDDRPSFLFHLGDVVYDFGESQYYYDQFYEPFRNYPAPIFAIPGNHDSFIVPGTPEADYPLTTFMRNFCSESVAITKEARSLHRTAMTQPGVYFTLDAPFVRIIALFSNALEDRGVISGTNKKFKTVPNYQLDFLKAQLTRIKKEPYKGAVIIAVHHPPFSYSTPKGSMGNHSSSTEMLREIDEICLDRGVYPHAILCAHAHNYQRYTRTFNFHGKEIDLPFVLCGDSGHNVNPLTKRKRGQPSLEPKNGSDVTYLDAKPRVGKTSLILEKYDDTHAGYLRISANKTQLRIGFHQGTDGSILQSRFDLVTVDLASHEIVAN
jgi:Calcineurin-like phosphoesterase